MLAGCTQTTIYESAAPAPPLPVSTGFLDDAQRIGVATAFAPELAALLPLLEGQQEYVVNGRSFYTGALAGKPVVLFETGVSIVNASMNTQLLLDHFNIESVVVSGIAGGTDPALEIGDVTVPRRWAQYNEMIYMREIAPGEYATYDGYSTEIEPYGYMRPNGVWTVSADDPQPQRRIWFDTDPGLMEIAREAAPTVEFERCSPNGLCLDALPELVIGGSGVTGSVYLDNAPFREYLYDNFEAQVVEMETAAIAMVARANSTPFIAFRSLSDLAGGGDADENEMDTFMDLAAINAAAVVLAFLEHYPAEGM